jgi:hypothetical protein
MSPNTPSPPSDVDSPVEPSTDSPGLATVGGAQRTDVETAVPDGAPTHRCDYCERPFARESYLTLHHGLAHDGVLTDEEREAFEAAYAEEQASLRRFRIVALGLLVLLYFGFLFVFAVVT